MLLHPFDDLREIYVDGISSEAEDSGFPFCCLCEEMTELIGFRFDGIRQLAKKRIEYDIGREDDRKVIRPCEGEVVHVILVQQHVLVECLLSVCCFFLRLFRFFLFSFCCWRFGGEDLSKGGCWK